MAKLQTERYLDSIQTLAKYNKIKNCWGFAKQGDFWYAVDVAHKNGFKGEGKTIAIIDGGFNPEFLKLKNHELFDKKQVKDEQAAAHGTVVALLAAEIAPAAKLHLYPVSTRGTLDKKKLKNALKLAGDSDADIINLSLSNSGHSAECWLCDEVTRLTSLKKIVVAAVGNHSGDNKCPAIAETVLSVGFQSELRREIVVGDTLTDVAMWGKPEYPQAYNPLFTIIQPAEIYGSSFAAPLLSGALALFETSDYMKFFNASKIGAVAQSLDSLEIRAEQSTGEAGDELDFKYRAGLIEAGVRLGFEQNSTTKDIYLKALSEIPHQHNDDHKVWPPCIPCSIILQSLYSNAGRHFLAKGEIELADKYIKIAQWLAPWSPNTTSTLAKLFQVQAAMIEKHDAQGAFLLLCLSHAGFKKALKMEPYSKTYQKGLQETDERIYKLTGEKPSQAK